MTIDYCEVTSLMFRIVTVGSLVYGDSLLTNMIPVSASHKVKVAQ